MDGDHAPADERTDYIRVAVGRPELLPTYTVSWGDGQSDTGTGPVFTHSFLKPTLGTDPVTATALAAGYTLTATISVSVLNFTPTFTVSGGTGDAESGVPATLTASLNDPTGSGVSYSVDFGDGTSGPGYGPNPTHAFVFNPDANGNDTSTYTVTASVDGTSYVATGVEHVYMAGSGQITVSDSGPIDEANTFWLTATFTDSQQDPVQGPVGAAFVVSWGDGTASPLPSPVLSTYSLGHQYLEEGTYNVEVDAIYQETGSETYYRESVTHDTATVRPGNPVTFTATPDQLGYESTVTATLNFYDADDDQPVYTVSWGDGASSTSASRFLTHTYAYSTQTMSYALSASAATDDGTFQANTATVTVSPYFSTVSITGGGVAYEHNQQPADFYISRTGGDTTQPLTANLALGGTEDSSEYEAIDRTTGQVISGSVTFLANEFSKDIEVIPLEDNTPEWTDTILAMLQPAGNYAVNPTYSTATISVADGDLGITLGNGSDNIIMQGSPLGNQHLVGLTLNAPRQPRPGATITLSESADASVWDAGTQIMGYINGTLVQHYSWSTSAPPTQLQVGAVGGSDSVGDVGFTLTASDGITSNETHSNTATAIRLSIIMYNDPNSSGDYMKDISGSPHDWLVGQVVDLRASLIGPASVTRFAFFTWDVPGDAAYKIDEPPSGSYRHVIPLDPMNVPGSVGTWEPEVRFFWISTSAPDSSERNTIVLSAQAGRGPLTTPVSVTTDFVVFTPSASVQLFTGAPGIAYLTPYVTTPPGWYVGMTPTTALHGVNWITTVTQPPGRAFGAGQCKYVQLVDPAMYETRQWLWGGLTQDLKSRFEGQWVLDNVDPYDGPWSTAPASGASGDTPGIPLTNEVVLAVVAHQFKTYVMYKAPGTSEWGPIQSGYWSVYVGVQRNGNTWVNIGTPASTVLPFQEESSEPIWDNVLKNSTAWVVNRG